MLQPRKSRDTPTPPSSPRSSRRSPSRSAERWADEYAAASRLWTREDRAALRRTLAGIALANISLRELRPASVWEIVRSTTKLLGITHAKWILMASRLPPIMATSPERTKRQIDEVANVLGVARSAAAKLIVRDPALIFFGAGELRRRAEAVRLSLRLRQSEARKMLIRRPSLLSLTPATLRRHVRDMGSTLGLDAASLAGLVKRQPQLIMRSPEKYAAIIDGMVGIWGWPREDAIERVMKCPGILISGTFESLDRKVTHLAARLNVERTALLKAVSAFLPLAYLNPDRLADEIGTAAGRIGVSVEVLVAALLRSPSLFARRKEGWGRSLRLVRRLARALGVEISNEDILRQLPAALTYSRSRLLQRYVAARLGLCAWNWTYYLTCSDEKMQRKFREYFKAHPETAIIESCLLRRGLV